MVDPIDSGMDEDIPERSDQFPAAGPNSLASIGRRFAARLLDALVLAVPAYLLLAPHFDTESTTTPYDGPAWLYYLVAIVMPAVYEIGFVAWRGQTVGKVVVGIRVARIVDGAVPNVFQAAVRALLPIAVANVPIQPIFSLLAIGIYLMAVANPLRQGLHDRAAATVVVSTK